MHVNESATKANENKTTADDGLRDSLHAMWGLDAPYQPRSRHSVRCGRSAPRVVSSPWPG